MIEDNGRDKMPIKTTVEFLSAALNASDMGGSRGKLDMFADRLVKAASEPTLSVAVEHLLRAVNASADSIHPPLAAQMVRVANGPDGPANTALVERAGEADFSARRNPR